MNTETPRYEQEIETCLDRIQGYLGDRKQSPNSGDIQATLDALQKENRHFYLRKLRELKERAKITFFLEDVSGSNTISEMRELLVIHFPEEYGPKRLRDPKEYEDWQITRFFSNELRSAHSYADED